MIHRTSAAVLLLGFFGLGSSVFFYLMIPEEWMAAILISIVFAVSSGWLAFFWALKVVSPFIAVAAESATKDASYLAPVSPKRGSLSKWILGAGVPLLIVSLAFLSFLFFPIVWMGTLVIVVYVFFLVRYLRRYSFFARQNSSGLQTTQEE